jgi:hypothetical protein
MRCFGNFDCKRGNAICKCQVVRLGGLHETPPPQCCEMSRVCEGPWRSRLRRENYRRPARGPQAGLHASLVNEAFRKEEGMEPLLLLGAK